MVKNKKLSWIAGGVMSGLVIFHIITPVLAEDYSSTNFILRDPVTAIEAGFSESSGFQYFSSSGEIATGESTISDYILRSGSRYYPEATSAVVTATAGNNQVGLTWTASVGTLANITTYELGVSTVSGASYTFQEVGNVLSYTKTGLTNGTTYYFVIRAYAGSLLLVTSAEVSSTPTAPSSGGTTGGSSGGGGGGGGGGSGSVVTQINFSGRAYPNRTVTLLKDAQVVTTTIAGPTANFQITLNGTASGNYIFSLYSEDLKGIRSSLVTFPVSVTFGATINVSGIFIAPTIDVDKDEIKKGENIAIFGQSVPQSEITIVVNSEEELFAKTQSDTAGVYLYNFDTQPLELGPHTTKSKSAFQSEVSAFSSAVGFKVGDKSVPRTQQKCKKADLNCDGKVNLVDFSIAAFWYKRTLSDAFLIIEKERLNGDNKIDIVDFSVMAFYWTG